MKVPDGVEIDKEFLGSFTAALKDELVTKAGLKPEVASEFGTKLATMYAERRGAEAKAQKEALEKQSADWVEAFKKDKDFGGANLATSVVNIARVRTMVPEAAPAVAFLEEVGLGNHPLIARFYAALGKHIGEDTTRVAGGSGGGPLSYEERLKLRYDKSTNT